MSEFWMSGFWIYQGSAYVSGSEFGGFWMYQGSEYTWITQDSEYAWL